MNKEKIYILEGLGCANCAAKMEAKIQALPEVTSASLTFATKQLKIESADPDALETKLQQICQSIESEVRLVDWDNRIRNGAQPGSGITAAADNFTYVKAHSTDIITLAIGAVLFAAGVVFEHVWGYDMWFAGGGRIMLITFCVFLLAYLLLGHRVLLTAGRNILRGQIFDENFLMSIATVAAFCIGEFAEGAGVMLFYRIGELFEDIAVEKSRTQIMEAVDMRPETVALVEHGEDRKMHAHSHDCGCGHAHHHDHHEDACEHDHGSQHACNSHACETPVPTGIRIIPAEEAKPGDILLVRPGDRIPLDGIVVEGESRIDTSPVTGEPVPVSAHPGTEVISGCVNEQGVLKIRVTHPLSESMVTRILNSVENAAAGKPKIDKFITRFARVYTPIVVALAVLTAILPSLLTGQWSFWITTAITFLVISCPCALVISVPLAFFSGIGAASKLGILFKGGLAIEALKNIKAVIMDKTGTITRGVFAVDRIVQLGGSSEAADRIAPSGDAAETEVRAAFTEKAFLAIAASCEAASSHPVAVSIMEKAAEMGLLDARGTNSMEPGGALCIKTPTTIEEVAGMGIRATFASIQTTPTADAAAVTYTALCGNRKLMKHHGVALPELPSAAGTEVLVALDGRLIGQIIISDQLKDDSVCAIGQLKSLGLIPAMLTGDNMQSAAAVASASGIGKVRAGLLPEEKLTALTELRDELGAVMFVGDGINDAPVLAGADVGAAMGSGADAAIEAADVVFMNSSLRAVPQSIAIARYTGRIAMQNIVFALAIKLLVILLGFAGFANIWTAVFADTGVAMLCILNSLRVLWRKY